METDVEGSWPFHCLLESVPPLLKEHSSGSGSSADAVDRCLERIETIARSTDVDAINIPDIHTETSHDANSDLHLRAKDRMPARDYAVLIQQQLQLPCIVNKVVADLPGTELLAWVKDSFYQHQVQNFVFVGGASSAVRYPGPSVAEANRLVRETIDDPQLKIGNICIPHRRREEERVREKVNAGVDFFTTQILYETQSLSQLLQSLTAGGELKESHPPFYVSLCPLHSLASLHFLLGLGVDIPDTVAAQLSRDPGQIEALSMQTILKLWQELNQNPELTQVMLGLNVAPIGKLSTEKVVELVMQLKAHLWVT